MSTRSIFLLILIGLFTTACGESSLPELTPDAIISSSAERMNGLDGFYYTIDRTGAPAFLDNAETVSFRRAEGYYAAPDRSQATVRIITPGLVTEVNVISIGEIQWQTNVMSTGWERLPPNWGFNPAVLFDPEIGIQSILATDVTELKLLESEELEEGPEGLLYVLDGSLDGGRIHELSYGLIGPEKLEVRLWIVPETFELARAVVTESNSGEDEPSVWQVDFSRFDEVVDIEPPNSG